ncbi:MAG: hypothetical protein VX910_12075, partial [Candidatus Latescibacterota bacterium]|nr:hypothetical protein [Candidatus Latescibacterota bacterium]
EWFFLYCFLAFGLGYIAFDRIQVFFVFFAALIAGRWLLTFPDRRTAAIVGLCVFIGYEIHNDTRFLITVHRAPQLPALVEWVRKNTAEDDVILAAFHISPSILTYTNRSIVQHPKFESQVIREKTEQFLEGLFSSEEEFYQLARRWEADWYVYQASMALDTSKESPRYVAGRKVVPPESALYGFHFAPETLKHFHLAHQNSYYRMFKVGDPLESRPQIQYQPGFDLSVFTNAKDVMPADTQIEKVRSELGNPAMRLQLADALYLSSRYSEAADEYERLSLKQPADAILKLKTANAMDKAGRSREAARQYLMALRAKPDLRRYRFETENGQVFRDGARVLLEAGNMDAGTRWLEKAVSLLPDDVEAATNLGILFMKKKETIKARKTFEQVISTKPDYPLAYLQIGLLDQSEGRHQQAIDNLTRYLELDPASPNRQAVRKAIQEIRTQLQGY